MNHEPLYTGGWPSSHSRAASTSEAISNSTTLSISVDPVALITTECIGITSAMRKSSRWAQSSVSAILGGGMASRYYERGVPRPVSSNGAGRIVGKGQRESAQEELVSSNNETLASRWGLRGKKGKSIQDNPLMTAFARLRSDMTGVKDINAFDAPSLLHPFLQVIRSSSTSASITSLAVVAITKFFSYNILNANSPRMSVGMQLLSAAITHCRFEASDSSADEIVLLRILKLMESMLSRPEGRLLGDESVCEMMETGLSMCCQARLSEVLRRSAEMAMVNMCQVIFGQLKRLPTEQMTPFEGPSSPSEARDIKMDPQLDGLTVTSRRSTELGADASAANPQLSIENLPDTLNEKLQPLPEATVVSKVSATADILPYGIPSIRELFRVLIDLLDPHNRQHTDSMRVMALRIIDVALEVAGPAIANHPSLAQYAKDDLCRHIFQLVRSENAPLLNGSLRVAGTLLATCRRVLKLQQELFLSYLVACLHPRIDIPSEPGIDPSLYEGVPQAPKLVKPSPSNGTASGRSTPVPVKDRQKLGMEGGSRKPETREAMVESIGTLVRIPSFMVELFVNYDCDVDRADICEDMIGLLSRNAFPDSATWSTTNVPPLCLDALLGFVQHIAERLDMDGASTSTKATDRLREQRSRKKVIIRGASRFNENPKGGIAFLASNGIIKDADDPVLVAKFLKGTSRISKKVLGDFISKKSNEQILKSFIDLFDFDNKRIDEALREVLGSFRLPGESQLIERIVTVFSEKYCSSSVPEPPANSEAAFVLTYAIIMLNTDLYNPNVKASNRMKLEDFSRNLRGVNDKRDFAPEYLQAIYSAIKSNEIILPEEHDNKHAFEYAWKELLMKTEDTGDLMHCYDNSFDAEMFRATWRPIIATLSYVFVSASDDAVFSRVVTGFDQCAQIAARYGIIEAFDRVVYCLSSVSTLATEKPSNTSLNTEVQAGNKSVMVSELAVKFGRDFRAQLAMVVLFRVLAGNEATISTSWLYVVRILINLFNNSMIPAMSGTFDEDLPPIPVKPPSRSIDRDARAADGGLLSAFTSYLSSYATDDPPEPSDEELENTLCTVDCVKACRIDALMSNITQLTAPSTKTLVASLLSQLPEESSPIVVVKPERPTPGTPRLNGHKPSRLPPEYSPGTIYVLEVATILTLRDEEIVASIGEPLLVALQSIIRNARNLHFFVVSRAVYYLLSLLQASYKHDFMRTPVALHAISSLDQQIIDQCSSPIAAGLVKCVNTTGPLGIEVTNSPDFWSILDRLQENKDVAGKCFEILSSITTSESTTITADNYESAINLANSFATAGSIGSIQEQQRDAAARRGKQKSIPKTQENPTVARGARAISIIHHLTYRIPYFISQSHLERNEAWAAYWSPIFRALSTQCLNPCREIRHQAMSALQRSLLSKDLASPDHTEWTAIFAEVLFPLIGRLLKPESYQLDPVGMSETRVHAATLLCKVFLHYLVLLSEWEGMLDLWLRILDVLDRMMNSGQGDALEEAVPESLKNILLVMADGGYLRREKGDRLWEETRKRLERFLPRLVEEVFPPPPPPADEVSSLEGPPEKVAAAPATAATAPQDEKAVGSVSNGTEKVAGAEAPPVKKE